jgi:hypothetical protein
MGQTITFDQTRTYSQMIIEDLLLTSKQKNLASLCGYSNHELKVEAKESKYLMLNRRYLRIVKIILYANISLGHI